MQLSFLKPLYAHMEWADALVWQTVLGEALVGSDDVVVGNLVHLHMVQHAWLSIWEGREVSIPTREDFSDVAEIRDWSRSYHRDAARFLATLEDQSLQQILTVPWTESIEQEIGGPASPTTLGDAVYQVVAHSVHHRAQVQARIREIGGSPGMVDYIGWIWRGQPAAEWSG